MRERLSDYQEQYGDLYNLEATPAESTSYRLAKHDKQRYPDIITAHEGATPYYTNSSHLPVGYTEDVFAALDVQDKLQTLYTSGTVFHTFLGEKLPSWQSAAALVRKIAENYDHFVREIDYIDVCRVKTCACAAGAAKLAVFTHDIQVLVCSCSSNIVDFVCLYIRVCCVAAAGCPPTAAGNK